MKVVIFAGGLGTRLMEETQARPKPMVEIGGKPILWHIMKLYEFYGFDEFIICLGYKSEMIKEYFMNYHLLNSDITIDLSNNEVEIHKNDIESFKVTLIDTGLETNTAGRLKRVKPYLQDKTFLLTYGDGVSNVNIKNLVSFHQQHSGIATLTAVNQSMRFGHLEINDGNLVANFEEKPDYSNSWINSGYFVLDSEIFEYLEDNMDDIQWERGPLKEISKKNLLYAYKHNGFWKAMDALRDRIELEKIWTSQDCPWKIW